MKSKTVLITGCSTGIGQDLARRLALANYTVIATTRHAESLAELPVALRLPLDVTDSTAVANATAEVVARFGRIDVLVNNAGYATRGAIEEITDEQLHELFNVNVFGAVRMMRAVAPQMRLQASGRIINISSISGRLVVPSNGAYSATKFALEALSDATRLELAPFGVQVVLIEPGSIRTNFMATSQSHANEILSNPGSPYRALYHQYIRYIRVEASMRRQERGPEVVSAAVQRAIEATEPKARYLVAFPFSGGLVLHLAHPVWDLVVKRMYKPGSATPVKKEAV